MAKPSWVGKYPSDMTDEELKQAKQAMADLVEPAQQRLNTLSAAVGQLNREINERFRMTTTSVPAGTLPEYPVDAVSEEFGSSTTPA